MMKRRHECHCPGFADNVSAKHHWRALESLDRIVSADGNTQRHRPRWTTSLRSPKPDINVLSKSIACYHCLSKREHYHGYLDNVRILTSEQMYAHRAANEDLEMVTSEFNNNAHGHGRRAFVQKLVIWHSATQSLRHAKGKH